MTTESSDNERPPSGGFFSGETITYGAGRQEHGAGAL